MDISLFRDLDRLKQTGNFSRAAMQVNLSQPAFSRRIKALETWVGTTLVDRSRQPVSLTESGAQILEAGMQALSRIESERNQIREAQLLPDRYVTTFAAQHSISWRFYPAWLQAFEDAYGPVLSSLRADDLPNCLRVLKKGEVDFVIAYQHRSIEYDSSAESILIGSDKLIPVCKPKMDGTPMFDFDNPDVETPFLEYGDSTPIGAQLKPILLSQGLTHRLRTVYENSMGGALRIRARSGDGVAWLSQSLVQPDLENKLLVRIGDPDWDVELDIRLYRNANNLNQVTRSIWSFLKGRQAEPMVTMD